MKIKLTAKVSGARNGRPWPAPGTVVDLPDDECQGLIATGMATDKLDGTEPFDKAFGSAVADHETGNTPAAPGGGPSPELADALARAEAAEKAAAEALARAEAAEKTAAAKAAKA